MKISFIHTYKMNQNLRVDKTSFHMKDFTLGLALKQRWKASPTSTNPTLETLKNPQHFLKRVGESLWCWWPFLYWMHSYSFSYFYSHSYFYSFSYSHLYFYFYSHFYSHSHSYFYFYSHPYSYWLQLVYAFWIPLSFDSDKLWNGLYSYIDNVIKTVHQYVPWETGKRTANPHGQFSRLCDKDILYRSARHPWLF